MSRSLKIFLFTDVPQRQNVILMFTKKSIYENIGFDKKLYEYK